MEVIHHRHHQNARQQFLQHFSDLEAQIQEVSKRAVPEKGSKNRSSSNSIIPESMFENDNAGNDICLRPSSSLVEVQVDENLGSGSIWFDKQSATQVQNKNFNVSSTLILLLRQTLVEAKDIVRKCIPPLSTLLNLVLDGYDSNNNTYEAFCNGNQIIVNLYSFIPKLGTRTLVHDFIIVVTHELAHFLEPTAGHGPIWRDTHMKMVTEVMRRLQKNEIF